MYNNNYNQQQQQGRIKGGGHFEQVPVAPRFRGAPQIFWASRLFMAPCFSGPHRTVLYRGAGAPRFNIKYESRTFLCN